MTPKKDLLLDFIITYRSLPMLWDVQSPEYSNRAKKAAAYEILGEQLRRLDGTSSRESVVKKLNNLRSTFRKELKKVNESKRSSEEVYVPKLWYFNELLFLVDSTSMDESLVADEGSDNSVSQPPSISECPITRFTSEPVRNTDSVGASSQQSDAQATPYLKEDDDENSLKGYTQPPSMPEYSFTSFARKAKRKGDNIGVSTQQFLAKAAQCLTEEDDECLTLVKGYATKMRKLSPEQLLFADKVINDALFEAQLGLLTRSSSVSH